MRSIEMIAKMIVKSSHSRRRTFLRPLSIISMLFLALFSWTNSFSLFCVSRQTPRNGYPNLSMSEGECRSEFPGLMKEIDWSIERLGGKGFDLIKQGDDSSGIVEGRIKDGKLYVISVERRPTRDMLYERQAILHSLHRALITSPTPLPDTVFTFSVIDSPRQNAWSFARSNDSRTVAKGNWWVMPHFSGWSWPKRFIGTMDDVLGKIAGVEKMGWESKAEKAVWRGTAWFNSVGNTQLRPKLLEAAKNKPWADVQSLKWVTNAVDAENALNIEDFCKYKYIIYTEGITYSGRLPFHLACGSVIITTPLTYLMHTTHLLRPLISVSLPFSPSYTSSLPSSPNPRWSTSYSPSDANIIFVEPDWSDLEQTINWLQNHDDVAKSIAKRQRQTFAEGSKGGILGEAAEVCYWRQLIKGWASVVREKNGTHQELDRDGDNRTWGEGIRWETFSLMGVTSWDRAQ